jgi:outer membrane biosynthesis protein TonB
MRYTTKFLAAVLALAICLGLVSCAFFAPPTKEETPTAGTTTLVTTPEETTPQETTPQETTPEESTPEETPPIVTEPDFSNSPDPDGTKRY